MTTNVEQVEVVDGEPVIELAVVPYTGEALPIRELPLEQLAQALDEARMFERDRLSAFKRDVQDEILRRMDERAAAGEDGAWTLHVPGYTVQGDSPDRTDYDVDELRKTLTQLADAGLVSAEVLPDVSDKWVIVPERWKAAKRKLTQLTRLGGPVKDAIALCERPVTRPRAVRITPNVGGPIG